MSRGSCEAHKKATLGLCIEGIKPLAAANVPEDTEVVWDSTGLMLYVRERVSCIRRVHRPTH